MARLWSCGFELNSTSNGVEWDTIAGSPTIQTTTKRSGTYAGRITSLSSGTAKSFLTKFASGQSDGPYFFRVYFRAAAFPSAANKILDIYGDAGAGVVYLTVDNAGALRLLDEDGQIGLASSALSTGTWYRLEIQYDRTPAAGSHVLRARIDGTEFAGLAARNFSVGIHTFRIGGNLNGETQTAGDWFFDDAAINSNTGSNQTTYPGEGSIVHLHPNNAGDNAQGFSFPAGTAAWDTINENTPNDATDYYTLDGTNDILDVKCELSSVPGIGTSDTITFIQVGSRTTGAAAQTRAYRLRIKSQASGTVLNGTTVTGGTTDWGTNGQLSNTSSIGLLNYTLTSYTDPQAGGNWTPALINTMQIGAQATDATPDVQVSTLWALVEYIPQATELNVSVFENVTVAEDVQFNIPDFVYSAEVNDAITVSENITNTLEGGSFDVSVFDTVSIREGLAVCATENPIVRVEGPVEVNDSVTLAENIETTLEGFNISVFDAIGVSESIEALLIHLVEVNDAITVSENVETFTLFLIDIYDTVTLAENVTNDGIGDVSVFDTIAVSESIQSQIAGTVIVPNNTLMLLGHGI